MRTLGAVHAIRRTVTELNRRLNRATDQAVSLADMMVVHDIMHDGAVTPGQIMDSTGLTSGAVTSVIGRLEKEGLVERAKQSEDKRVVHVRLVHGAEARLMQMMQSIHGELADLFEGWSEAQIQDLVDQLGRLHLSGTQTGD